MKSRARKQSIVINVNWDNIQNKPIDLGSASVTFETLQANGDTGTGADQVAVGNHNHALQYAPIHSHPYRADSWVPDWSVITGKPSTFAPSAHSHPITEVTALQPALDAKANKNNAALTGTPTAPTPSQGDNSTNIATTAFVFENLPEGTSVAIDDAVPIGDDVFWFQPSTALFSVKVDGQWVTISSTYQEHDHEVGDVSLIFENSLV